MMCVLLAKRELEFWTGCLGRVENGRGRGRGDEEFAPFIVESWRWCWSVRCDWWRNQARAGAWVGHGNPGGLKGVDGEGVEEFVGDDEGCFGCV